MDKNIVARNVIPVEDLLTSGAASVRAPDHSDGDNQSAFFRLRWLLCSLPGPRPTSAEVRAALKSAARAEAQRTACDDGLACAMEDYLDAARMVEEHREAGVKCEWTECSSDEDREISALVAKLIPWIEHAPVTDDPDEQDEPPDPEQWNCVSYITTEKGVVRPLLANAELAFRKMWTGVLAYDNFSLSVTTLKDPPWFDLADAAWPGSKPGEKWTDNDDRLAAIWLQRQEAIYVSDEVAGKAIQTVAHDHRVHPVRAYLRGLIWDGTPRLNAWLSTYLGVAPSPYAAAVGARWPIAAVARIFRPGCKSDCCLILEGPQGGWKSTAIRTLADPWFTDEIAELGSKDAALQTRGVWVIELSELDAMAGAEIARVKAFMSRSTDRFRPPYGRLPIDSSRQCIFAGTVNHSAYLKDETGGRRFWPVACGRINIEALARDRDQLWAEAVVRYRKGEPWWLDSSDLHQLATQEQADRYEGDAWDEIIAEWVKRPYMRPDEVPFNVPLTSTSESVCIPEILYHAIGKRPEHWTQADRNRVARSLRSMGYERYRERGDKLEWRYRKRRA
jgi:hypothetical protein